MLTIVTNLLFVFSLRLVIYRIRTQRDGEAHGQQKRKNK